MIQLYSTPTCHWCHKTKDYFKTLNIEYENYDVSVDEKRAMEMIEKSGQMGVPVIDIDGKIIIGFNKPAIDEALSKQKKTN